MNEVYEFSCDQCGEKLLAQRPVDEAVRRFCSDECVTAWLEDNR